MLGDSLSKQGGIVTLEKLMLKHAPADMEIQHIGTVVDGMAISKIIVFASALIKFIFQLVTTKVDLVHIHVAERGSAYRKAIITLIAKLFKKPAILHSNSPEFHEFYQGLSPLLQGKLVWAFSQCDRFIAVSESWRNFYVNKFGLQPEQVLVLANPIELPKRVNQRTKSEQINIVCLGRIGQRKGVFDLIKAFAQLPQLDRNCAKLILAGDGEIEKAGSLVKSLNLQKYVTIYNWLNPQQRDEILAKANIFVLATYNEGLPLALLEAMGWALPVITTPVGGIPDIIISQQNGLLVTPGNISQITEAMRSLIQDEKLRLRLGENARATVVPFDIHNYYTSLQNIYDSILGLQQPDRVRAVR